MLEFCLSGKHLHTVTVHDLGSAREITGIRLPQDVLWMPHFLSPWAEHEGLCSQTTTISSHSHFHNNTCLPSDLYHSDPLPGTTSSSSLNSGYFLVVLKSHFSERMLWNVFVPVLRDPVLGPFIDFEFRVRSLWPSPTHLLSMVPMDIANSTCTKLNFSPGMAPPLVLYLS